MKEGSTATWAFTTTKKTLTHAPPNFGNWDELYSNFITSPIHIDVKNEAITWLTTTFVSKTLPLNDYISQFKNQVTLNEINNKDALINLFSRGIPIALMRRIYAMDTIPTTIDKCYKHTIHFKIQWDRADAIAHKCPYNPYPTQKSHMQNHQTQPKVNLYTMDVNCIHIEKLTPQEREWCRKLNLCLHCRKPGHYRNNCPTFPNKENTPCQMQKPLFQKKPQPEPKKISMIEEERIEEVIEEEEEYVAKVSNQDF